MLLLLLELRACLEQARVGISVILLLFLVSLDPELSRLLFIGDHFIQTLDTIVQLSFRQFKGFLYAHLLCFKRGLGIDEFILFLV